MALIGSISLAISLVAISWVPPTAVASPASSPSTASIPTSISGHYWVQLQNTGSSCFFAAPMLQTRSTVQQQGPQILVTIPNFGTYRGRTTQTGFQVQTTYRDPQLSCTGDLLVRYNNSKQLNSKQGGDEKKTGEVTATADVSCDSGLGCELKYRGKAVAIPN